MFFGLIEKKDGRPVSDWLTYFGLLLWNCWTEFKETWKEVRSQHPLLSLCFFWDNRKNKMAAPASDWLRYFGLLLWPPLPLIGWYILDFSSDLKPLNGIQPNLTGSKISMSFTKFVFWDQLEKQDGRPGLWFCWDIFDFSSETAERNSMKLYRKQDLNVLYQVCVFWANRKNKMAAPASDWLRHFGLLLWPPLPLIGWYILDFSSDLKPLNEIQPNLTGSKISVSSTKFVFWDQLEKQDGHPGLWLAETFSTSLLKTAEWNSTIFDRKQVRSQRPLLSLCIWSRLEKQDGHPGLWLAETFSTSLKQLNGIQGNLTGSKISTFSTKFVFFGPIRKPGWPSGLWLAETFWTTHLELLNGIQDGSTYCTHYSGERQWPLEPLV